MLLKIGELAKQTGLTIRALRHYDDIGLLSPSIRSDAGYRLYGQGDVARLHSIQALKQLGLDLAGIGNLLAGGGIALPELIARQLTALEQRIAEAQQLRTQLLRLQGQLARGDEPKLADWLATLELMAMLDRYFSKEEGEQLQRHALAARDDIAVHWPALVRTVRGLMDAGVAVEDPAALACAREWTELLERRVGGDSALLVKLHNMTLAEPAAQAHAGIDGAMVDYVCAVIAASRVSIYARYLTPDEMAQWQRNRGASAAKWPPLIAAMREKMSEGAAPGDAGLGELARQWQQLFEASFANGDAGLRIKLREVFQREPELMRGTGMDPALLDFVRRATMPSPA